MDEFCIEAVGMDGVDDTFENDRRAAQEKIADAENALFAARLDQLSSGRVKTIREAKKKLRVAIEALKNLEEEWQNEHAFDHIAI